MPRSGVEVPLAALAAKAEQFGKEMRPIWKKTLVEIIAVGENVKLLSSRIDLLTEAVLNVRTDRREADLRVKEFESLLHWA